MRRWTFSLGGHSYPVDSRLVSALQAHPQFYNAGVVGPDGFPDVIFGQSQIHPVHTGKWLRYIVQRAWAAQTDPRYSSEQRAQILAFGYGFLTHAAGDMWAHTLINDFAGGVFPAFKELIQPDKAKIAVRHLIAEGYAGNATPGWDRSADQEDRGPVCTAPGPPGTNCNDVSDDQTHGIPFDAPHEFIYDTLVDPNVPLPVGTCNDGVDDDEDGTPDDGCPGHAFTVGDPEPQRGPLLDFFLDLEADVQVKAADYNFDADPTNCTTRPGLLTTTARLWCAPARQQDDHRRRHPLRRELLLRRQPDRPRRRSHQRPHRRLPGRLGGRHPRRPGEVDRVQPWDHVTAHFSVLICLDD